MTHRRLLAPALVAAFSVAAACSGDDGAVASPAAVAVPAQAFGARTAPTDDTATIDASTSGDDETVRPSDETTTPTITAAPTTTAVPLVRMPLTGFALEGGQTPPERAAMVVKVDNNRAAWPQSGLNQADIVYEEIVEGRETRFAAVFHSQGSNPVGPIRSGRTQDVDLLGNLQSPLFVWSGGNGRVEAAIADSDLVSVNATGSPPGPGFYRSPDNPAPHNLYNNTDPLWEQLTWAIGRPQPLFDYVEPGTAPGGEERAWIEVQVGNHDVRWDWDEPTGAYVRTQDGRAHNATDGRVTTDNVVVLVVGYRPSPADRNSPEAQTLGGGFAFVMRGGQLQVGAWNRAERTDPFTLTTAEGEPILLAPGRTWVELADATDHDTTTG